MSRTNKNIFKTDIPIWVLLLLAASTLPRAILHDLHTIPVDSFLYKAMAVIPFLIILGFAVLRKNKRPFYDFLVMGVMYGVGLAAVHMVFWDSMWQNVSVDTGGGYRFVVAWSSLMTGVVTGSIFGLVALIAHKIRSRKTK